MKKWLIKHISLISILLLITSLILLGGSLIFRATNIISELNPIIVIIGYSCTIIGFILTLYEHNNNKSKRGFKPVTESKRKNEHCYLPTRGTKNSAGYDFYAPDEYIVKPNEIVKIWTDVKAYMQPNEFLILNVRSSMGGKFMLANTIGIVDSDYYSNIDNDGNIGFFLKNISDQTQLIKMGDRIGQGIFLKYLTTDNDNFISETRKGGFGSSGK